MKKILFLLIIAGFTSNSLDGMMTRILKPHRPSSFTRSTHNQFDYPYAQQVTQRKIWPVVAGWSLGVGALAFVGGALGGMVLGYHAGKEAGHECGQHDANIHMFLALSQIGARGIIYNDDGLLIPSNAQERIMLRKFFDQAKAISGIESDPGRFIMLSTHPHPSTLFERSSDK